MNVTSPVASEVTSVEFSFLSPEEILAVSVKQIVNPVTFSPTLPGKIPLPLAGGLYDPALGASATLRQRCSTCHLDYQFCPGHMGHISLPIPIYNVTFFDQMLRLLRATCVYCFHFRLSKAEADRYACKLRLIQYGLLAEAHGLESMHMGTERKAAKAGAREEEGPGEDLEGVDDEDDLNNFIARRREFVDKLISKKGHASDVFKSTKIRAVADARRRTVKEFLAEAPGVRKCTHCQAYSPAFRPDSHSKIFEKPLNAKQNSANRALGLRRTLAALDRRRPPGKADKKDQPKVDEGISIDMGEEPAEESEDESVPQDSVNESGKLLPNIEVYNTLVRLFENEKSVIQMLYQPRSIANKAPKAVTADMFFLHTIAIPPTCFRPPQATGGEVSENASNKSLVKILQDCLAIRDHKANHGDKQDHMQRLFQAFVTLQEDVNTFIDSSKSPLQGLAARGVENGIKQVLEKKEGLFRMNMMGKRVNFAARSVISPDPNIETSEIGVPLVFAQKLTYPEPVTDDNYSKLSEFVINGPDQWPGAVAIEMENGTVQRLPAGTLEGDRERRADMAKLLHTPDPLIGDLRPKKVLRHLMNNDYVLMNRQPTLHKPSIMGHKARVLKKERTIRMHYANCNTYNADFDGDEMNMHLPQNAIGQAEAREIASTNMQYLVGTSGKPLRGLIQDHLVMAVALTQRDTFFTREEYQQLLYSGLLPEQHASSWGQRVKTVPPAVMKPRALWTGKQVITSVLENIRPEHFDGLTLFSKSKVPGDRWYKGCEEGEVIFHQGYLACGILDKNQIGPTEFGFVHSIYEIYGAAAAGRLLSILGRLLTKLLHMRAHTCGMDDLLLTPAGNAQRRKTLDGSRAVGRELAVEYVGLKGGEFREKELKNRLEEVLRDENKHRTLDLKANASTKNFTSNVIRQCLPDGLVKEFPRNSFQAMTVSGAKGSDVNASQISCLLGQQVLEGRRVPVMVSGKTLPCFKPYETDVRAGGYITDRFLTGIRPQEFFFHCMAGREGLIDTAVKTSRSGYLQRCLIKGMEGMRVAYDNTVRDSDGSLVQFLYGEDGLDVAKQKHLHQFKFCAQNMYSLLRRTTEDYTNADLHPTLVRLADSLRYEEGAGRQVKKALKKYNKKKDLSASEVTMSLLNPSRYIGSVSEKFYESREEYIEKNPDAILSKKDKAMAGRDLVRTLGKAEFRTLMDLKYLRSIIDPGEAVGIIAGQSIGEPSTQMTLNTFHLAGHATKNVTLGIPRLREIVMTASANIGTPAMTLTLRPHITDQEAEQLTKRCSRLMLSEVIDSVSVTENVTKESKTYLIRLDLFPAKEYAQEYSVTKKQIHYVLKNRFLRALDTAIAKALDPKRVKSKALVGKDDAIPEVGESFGPSEVAQAPREGGRDQDDDGDESDEEDEGDATSAKRRAQKVESASYEKPDAEEEDIVDLADREASQEEDEGLGESMNEGSDAEASQQLVKESTDSLNTTSFEFDSEGQWCEIKLEYPAEAPKVLMLGIVEKVCKDAVIHQLPGITSISKVPASELTREEQAAGKRKLAVEGVNFRAIWEEDDIIDPNTIESNDIACVLRTYGVEACRNNIVKEMDAVFGGHGISVDNRHLNLIADIMTRGGGYTPFNRQGMMSSVSPLMKMSFETTCQFLKDATLEGDVDDLTSPSSRIVLGKISGVGTGSFDVMVGGL